MAQSRKDSRGYALRSGECQRADGRYSYSYTDRNRKRHTVYGKDLVELRKKEQQIRRDLEDGLDPQKAEHVTVNEVFDSYIKQKYDLKPTTRTNYVYTYDHYVRETFGKRRLIQVRYTDVREYYYSLLLEEQLSSATVDNVHTVLHPACQMAVRDGLIRVNPAAGVLGEIKKSHVWVKTKRKSLTVPEQKAFMNYLYSNHQYQGWRPVITVLIGSGMRIGECLGLRWEDLDFENRIIDINHSLVHRKVDDSGTNFHINTPKTEAGCRRITMIGEVYDDTQEVFVIFSGEKVLVDLRCDNSLMKTMVDRFGEDVTTLAYDMTSFRVQTEVSASPTFFGWVFGFNGKVQILAPKSVKEQYRQMIAKADEDMQESE